MTSSQQYKPTGPEPASQVLPLRLEPFEEYLVRDERPGYSMVFSLSLLFRGSIQRAQFEQALVDTLAYEPLLTALVVRRSRQFKWIPCSQPTTVKWKEEATPADQAEGMVSVAPIDLWHEPGLKVAVTTAPQSVKIDFSFHHACTDGVGANRFIGNVMARYGELVGDGIGLTSRPPQPRLISQRSELDITLPEPLTATQKMKGIIKESLTWLTQRPTPLAIKTSSRLESDGQVVLWRRLEEEIVDRLRACASRSEVGLNDLLIRDLFQTIQDWNASHGNAKESDLIRLLIPTNLRKIRHRRLPAANIMGYGFLNRTIADCREGDEKAFLSGIGDEVRFIRDWSLGSLFLHGLQLFRSLPGALRLLTSERVCHATCVLSSLGPFHATLSHPRFRREKTMRVGDLSLINIVGAPPVRPRTRACLGAIIHQGTLCMAGTFDLNQLTPAEANQFFEQYLARLEQTAQSGSSVVSSTSVAQTA